MGRFDEIREKKRRAMAEFQETSNELNVLKKDTQRVAQIIRNADYILDDLDKQFEEVTGLDSIDVKFLFMAIGLQCVRQYVIGTITQRTDHDKSDKLAHEIQNRIFDNDGKYENYGNESVRYRATTEEIMYSLSVPYDVTTGTKKYGVGGFDSNGIGIGLSGVTHRYKTLGHDPLLGWVFGTANIMTNTLTNNLGMTFHVKSGQVVSYGGHDKTIRMFEHVKKRSIENPADLGLCVIKQGLHIMSDTYSKQGIPLPGAVMLSEQFAKEISSYGIDLGNVIKVGHQAGYAMLINQIIAMIHGMYYDKSICSTRSLYSVKTKKIIIYSNVIASTSNVIAVAISTIFNSMGGNIEGVKKSLNYLDLGGIAVAIHQVVNNKKMIAEIKREFIKNEFRQMIMGNIKMED